MAVNLLQHGDILQDVHPHFLSDVKLHLYMDVFIHNASSHICLAVSIFDPSVLLHEYVNKIISRIKLDEQKNLYSDAVRWFKDIEAAILRQNTTL